MGAGDYLDELKNAPDQDMAGWFIPKDVLKNKAFKQVFDSYMSDDRKMTKIDVILEKIHMAMKPCRRSNK